MCAVRSHGPSMLSHNYEKISLRKKCKTTVTRRGCACPAKLQCPTSKNRKRKPMKNKRNLGLCNKTSTNGANIIIAAFLQRSARPPDALLVMSNLSWCNHMLVHTPNLAPHRLLHVYFSSSDMLPASRRTEQGPWKRTSINTNKDKRQRLIQASYSRGASHIEVPTSRQRLHGMQENVRAHASARHADI